MEKVDRPAFMEKAVVWPKGNTIDDFEVGRVFEHHWGRTINAGDNSLFTTLTQCYNPIYFNEPYAKEQGHPGIVVAPLLVFNTIVGLSVEDLSLGGPFVGINDCVFHKDVYVGIPLRQSLKLSINVFPAASRLGCRDLENTGFNQHGEEVISYTRSNLLSQRRITQ